MKRKITLLSLVLVIVVLATSLLFACNSKNDGKYYLYENDTKIDDMWIEVKGDKWTDSQNQSGTIKQNNDYLEFYLDNGEFICNAKAKDGVMVLITSLYTAEYRTDDATGSAEDLTQVGNSNVDNKAKVVSIQGGTVDGLTVNLDVGNEVTDVDLSGMLVVSNNSSWQLYQDKLGQVIIPTKYATNLVEGDNLYYVVVNSEDGSINRTYTLNVHKRYLTNIYLKANDQVVKTIENVLSHTTVELNAPSSIPGYDVTWSSSTYFVTERDKTIVASNLTPKTYTVTLNADGGTIDGESTKNVTFNSSFTLPVASKAGYLFTGWAYAGENITNSSGYGEAYEITDNATLVASYVPTKINLVVSSAQLNYGYVSNVSGEVDYGTPFTIVATPYTNCYFDGWYDGFDAGAEKISENAILMFTAGQYGNTIVARFVCYTLTTIGSYDDAGTYDSYIDTRIAVGEEVTLEATTNPGYIWLGWYEGTTKVSDGTSTTYTFTMAKQSRQFTAKWEICESHTTQNCKCTKCNLMEHSGAITNGVCSGCGESVYTREGNAIYFGEYPQSKVTDSTIRTSLNNSVTLPSESYSRNWTSYGYYYDGEVSNYMWYIDIELDGEKYRGVYFTKYRLNKISDIVASNAKVTDMTYQDDYGYTTGTTYWFKYEPIKWNIFKEDGGKAMIVSDLALDAQAYNDSKDSREVDGKTIYANNWEYSTIRSWLNDTFYKTSFNSLQKQLIVATTIDNKTTTYDAIKGVSNPCLDTINNTIDNIFLLSYAEMKELCDLNNELKVASDYAESQGVRVNDKGGKYNFSSKADWWGRGPGPMQYNAKGEEAQRIGNVGALGSEVVDATYEGVVPAIWIQL